ncbi:MAG TPA: hypothetical protein PKV41_03605 [Candidatus Omnitrophota bacterium]|nr:hypothetical protein [Candidatus Omnitrophota bacterium]
MAYHCSICRKKVEQDLMAFISHTEGHIMEEIRKDHPEWVEKNGLCRKCVDYYRTQIKGKGSAGE